MKNKFKPRLGMLVTHPISGYTGEISSIKTDMWGKMIEISILSGRKKSEKCFFKATEVEQILRKAIILIGPRCSGKTTIARAFASAYEPNQIEFIDNSNHGKFENYNFSKKKLIIIEECINCQDIDLWDNTRLKFKNCQFVFTIQKDIRVKTNKYIPINLTQNLHFPSHLTNP